MRSKAKKILNDMQIYVMHLRYKLAEYQIDGIDPPGCLLHELKVAENLVRHDSRTRE